MSTFEISSDAEVKHKVRALTGYEDSDDELPEPTLDALLDISKSRLSTKAGSQAWYTDPSLGQALLGVTAILAKSSVENYSVDSWTIGEESINVSGSGDDSDAQFSHWNQLVVEGLKSSNNADTEHNLSVSNTSEYIG